MNNSATIFQRLSSGNRITLYETKKMYYKMNDVEEKNRIHSTGV